MSTKDIKKEEDEKEVQNSKEDQKDEENNEKYLKRLEKILNLDNDVENEKAIKNH